MLTFADLGLKKEIVEFLPKINLYSPTPCQIKAIPLLIKGLNIGLEAETGSGKTHAFLLPILNEIDYQASASLQAIIMVPSNELALQTLKFARVFQEVYENLRIKICGGGHKINFKQAPHILIGSPFGLAQAIRQTNWSFSHLKHLIIDECDFILQPDFFSEINYLVHKINKDIKISLFSATISQELKIWAQKNINNFQIQRIHKTPVPEKLVTHYLIPTSKSTMFKTINRLITELNPYFCLIFVNNKKEIKEVYENLVAQNLKVIALSSDLTTRDRKKVFKQIQQLRFNYVICSDVMARGIDLPGISEVISLHPPKDLTFYWHRAGRTGRATQTGKSFLIYTEDDISQIKWLQKKGVDFKRFKFQKTV